MGKGEDPGLCLLGTTMLLHHVRELRERSSEARDMDVEGVHQTRVASRRVRAGLPIFSTCFKRAQYERWRNGVKGLTRALGEARDADVQIDYLRGMEQRVEGEVRRAITVLRETKEAQRRQLQEQVVGWLDNLSESGLLQDMEDRLSRTVENLENMSVSVRGRTGYATGSAHAAMRVAEVLKLDRYVTDPEAKVQHHQLRIAIKRLRYTLEAFRPLFDDELKTEVKALKEVQDLLGEMHDCDVWLDGIDAWSRDVIAEGDVDMEQAVAAIREDRSRERAALYARFTDRWSELRRQRFFERLPERFSTGASQPGPGIPLVEPASSAKIAIVSDVHGNMDALKAVLDDARQQGVGAFFNLGDMVGSGAYPEEVVRTLRGDHFLSVVGNFDLNVLEHSRAARRSRSRSMRTAIIAAAAKDLSEESLEFISSLPAELRLQIGSKKILMLHASPADPREGLGPDTTEERLQELAGMADADVVLVGHSHRAFVRLVDGVLFANPGSVGRPVDGDPRASYAVMRTDDMSIAVRRVEYDVEAAVRGLSEKKLPEEVAETLRRGISGKELDRERCAAGSSRACLEAVERKARIYNIDHPHAENVLRLATSLFRQLRPLHGLKARDRMLLEAGCLLHDVGTVEGMKGHHRTSYRIISEMDLPLTGEEKRMVACLARYHRKRPPRPDDPELEGLDEGAQARLFALASILRLADGLDYRHDGWVREVKCTITEDELLLTIKAKGMMYKDDLNMSKADLFESTFNRKVRLK